jgi:hypothetical protein
MIGYSNSFRAAILSCLILIGAGACADQTDVNDSQVGTNPDLIQVMVIGTYHFDNPGQDVVNIEASDMLSPSKQAELAAISKAITAFRPTAVAVDATADAPYTDEGWTKFTRADLSTDRNEIVQLGYRIASDASVDRVYAIDEQTSDGEPSYFPIGPVRKLATDLGQEQELSATFRYLEEWGAAFQASQNEKTVSELLLTVGELSDSLYWNILKFGDGENQPGPELAAYWFLRNAKIFNKLHQVANPGDRIVVVYGAGHSAWLREIVERTDGYQFVDATPYLESVVAQTSGPN